jgi:hypothetical protein
VRSKGERAHVVLLAREKEFTPVEAWLTRCVSDRANVTFSRLSWEAIYRALPADDRLSLLEALPGNEELLACGQRSNSDAPVPRSPSHGAARASSATSARTLTPSSSPRAAKRP